MTRSQDLQLRLQIVSDNTFEVISHPPTEGLTHALRLAFIENGIEVPKNLPKSVEVLFESSVLKDLVNQILFVPGGEGDFNDRYTSTVNAIHVLLSAVGEDEDWLGDLAIYTNVMSKAIKGASRQLRIDNGKLPLYRHYERKGIKLFFSMLLLPPEAINMIVGFLLDINNWV